MKRITLKELPEIITDEIFDILVDMAFEFPEKTFDWRDISNYLCDNNYPLLRKIFDKVSERQKAIEKAIEDAKSDEQKAREKRDWEELVKNADPKAFYGNMGEPETPSQYKGKYGVWPPGYDKFGNKIK